MYEYRKSSEKEKKREKKEDEQPDDDEYDQDDFIVDAIRSRFGGRSSHSFPITPQHPQQANSRRGDEAIRRLAATPTGVVYNSNALKVYQKIKGSSHVPEGITYINVPSLWSEGYQGKGEVCAIIDSGIWDHRDLADKVISRKDFSVPGGGELHPHGTHVSGTVAANGMLKGVAPQANLIDVRVLDKNGSCSDGTINNALTWLLQQVKNGTNVTCINMSIGGPSYNKRTDQLLGQLDKLGVVVCAAAGNEGDGNSKTTEVSYPGYDSMTMCVSAFNIATDSIADFSNSNREVDIAAPGTNVISTIPNNMYAAWNGTSMATPHVAGFVCLLSEKLKKERPQLSQIQRNVEIKRLITSVYRLDKGEPGVDDSYGYGVIHYLPGKEAGQAQLIPMGENVNKSPLHSTSSSRVDDVAKPVNMLEGLL